jgi:hypothetical protein
VVRYISGDDAEEMAAAAHLVDGEVLRRRCMMMMYVMRHCPSADVCTK